VLCAILIGSGAASLPMLQVRTRHGSPGVAHHLRARMHRATSWGASHDIARCTMRVVASHAAPRDHRGGSRAPLLQALLDIFSRLYGGCIVVLSMSFVRRCWTSSRRTSSASRASPRASRGHSPAAAARSTFLWTHPNEKEHPLLCFMHTWVHPSEIERPARA
jgi:hypothetical protein